LIGGQPAKYQLITNLDTACTPKISSEPGRCFRRRGRGRSGQPGRIDQFLRQTLNFENEQFDGVLVWDVLQYMTPALLTPPRPAAPLSCVRTLTCWRIFMRMKKRSRCRSIVPH